MLGCAARPGNLGVSTAPATRRLWLRSAARRRSDASAERGRDEAAKLALDQAGEGDRRAILQEAADNLNADGQAALGAPDRCHRRRQPDRVAGPAHAIWSP